MPASILLVLLTNSPQIPKHELHCVSPLCSTITNSNSLWVMQCWALLKVSHFVGYMSYKTLLLYITHTIVHTTHFGEMHINSYVSYCFSCAYKHMHLSRALNKLPTY